MGKPAGRGRPREIEDPRAMSVLVSADVYERLGVVADAIGISKTQLIRNLVEVGLEEAEVMHKLGLFGLVRWTETLHERLTARMESVGHET